MLTNTYFIVAHFHYVMMGSTLFAFIGGMYYWWPKMFGKMYAEWFAHIAFWFVFIGFNLAFFPQFIAGTKGMPRRYASYPVQFVGYHRASTLGAYTMGFGLVLVGLNWMHSLKRGRKAPDNRGRQHPRVAQPVPAAARQFHRGARSQRPL